MKTLTQKVFSLRFAFLTQVSLLVFWASLIFSTALMEISFTSALIFWILWKFQEKRAPQIDRFILVFTGGLLLWTALTVGWSELPRLSLRGFFKVAEQLLLFLITAETFSVFKNDRKWEKVFVGVLILLCID